ncbi:MAG: hypothetical protein ACPL3E_01815 [Minisyncoccia bacterium]
MFISNNNLKQKKLGSLLIKISNFLNKKQDYLLIKPSKQGLYFLAYEYLKEKAFIKAVDFIFVENLLVKINDVTIKNSLIFLIQEFIKKNLINPKLTIGIIPEEKVFYKLISLEKNINPPADLEKNILKNISEVNTQKYSFYFEKIYKNLNYDDYSVWITEKNYLTQLNEFLNLANLNIIGFEPESKLITKAILPYLNQKESYLIINILKEKTVFVILANHIIYFSGILNLGKIHLENSLKETLNKFLEEINRLLYFYTISNYPHKPSFKINKIVFFGDANPDFVSLISLNTKLKIESPKFWENLKFKNEFIKQTILENKTEFLPLIGGINKY